MVTAVRLRSILIPLALYAIAAALVGFFVAQAHQGERGLEAKLALKRQIMELNEEVSALKETRTEWERRIALLQAEEIDRDLLDEFARATLGRVHRSDVVVMFPAPQNTGR